MLEEVDVAEALQVHDDLKGALHTVNELEQHARRPLQASLRPSVFYDPTAAAAADKQATSFCTVHPTKMSVCAIRFIAENVTKFLFGLGLD